MGVAEGGEIFMLEGEGGKLADAEGELGEEKLKAALHEDLVRVVRYEAARGAEMDDACGFGSALSEGVDVGHYVVSFGRF